jgi:hypothetical protein
LDKGLVGNFNPGNLVVVGRVVVSNITTNATTDDDDTLPTYLQKLEKYNSTSAEVRKCSGSTKYHFSLG